MVETVRLCRNHCYLTTLDAIYECRTILERKMISNVRF